MQDNPARALSDAHKRRVVIGVLIAMFLAALDQTIVAPALPTIGHSLGDEDFLPWVVSAYLLTSTAVTPLYGKLSDMHGRRPIILAALGLFILGSIGCALAPSLPMLIGARALQGAGGGGLVALAQTVIADIASPRERSKYVVYISIVWATSSVAGPAVGGFFAQHLSWTLIFWINLPIGALALVICERILRDLPQLRRPHRLDILGSVLTILSSVALMLALTLGGQRLPWSSPPIIALIGVSLVLGGALVWHIRRVPEPLIPPALFSNRVIGMALGALCFSMAAFVGATVYLPLYFEIALGVDPTTAGAGLIVLLGGSVVGANSAGRMMPRIRRYKLMAYAGLALAIASLGALALFSARLNFIGMEILVFGMGVGLGPLFPTTTVCVQNAVDPRDMGIATATLAFLRSLGSAVGVAVFGAIIFAFGLAHVGEGSQGGAMSAELHTIAERAFGAAFAVMTLSVVIALGFVAAMEERPLRGPGPAMPATPEP